MSNITDSYFVIILNNFSIINILINIKETCVISIDISEKTLEWERATERERAVTVFAGGEVHSGG